MVVDLPTTRCRPSPPRTSEVRGCVVAAARRDGPKLGTGNEIFPRIGIIVVDFRWTGNLNAYHSALSPTVRPAMEGIIRFAIVPFRPRTFSGIDYSPVRTPSLLPLQFPAPCFDVPAHRCRYLLHN